MEQTNVFKCMVVDDESHAIEVLADYIDAVPQLYLEKTFLDPIAALLDTGPEEKYDFIFLDIDMPSLSGLELAKALRPRTSFLIFTTAHPKYAIDAFEVEADQFLLKPISMGKFVLTINRLLEGPLLQATSPSPADKTFFIKSDQKNKLIKICPEDIIAIEGLRNYVIIYVGTQRHIAYLTMKEIEGALQANCGFLRVHKSFIVAKQYIEGIDGRVIRMTGSLEVPIGETYRTAFHSYISEKALISSR